MINHRDSDMTCVSNHTRKCMMCTGLEVEGADRDSDVFIVGIFNCFIHVSRVEDFIRS